MTRVIALMALAALGLSGSSVHDPVHGHGAQSPSLVTVRNITVAVPGPHPREPTAMTVLRHAQAPSAGFIARLDGSARGQVSRPPPGQGAAWRQWQPPRMRASGPDIPAGGGVCTRESPGHSSTRCPGAHPVVPAWWARRSPARTPG